MIKLFIGFILSFIISYTAYRIRSLSYSGFWGALILGALLFVFGNFCFWVIIISFFISSSVLTKFKNEYKKQIEDISEKGGERDYIQVMANGFLGLIFAFLYYFTKDIIFLLAYAAAFASSNSDTWGSELGVLSKRSPISILSFKRIETGTSGGVSIFGTAASLMGAIFISFMFSIGYILEFGYNKKIIIYMMIITAGGFLGSILDSIIGASLQAKYKCIICGKIIEKPRHHGKKTIHISGVRWINNDIVNIISSFAASLFVIIAFLITKN